jgi:hypothetical protein
MLPYTYLPRHGEEITVVREGGTARIGVTRHTAMASAVIPADDMPGFAASVVAALYEAAGLPAPVILDRPAPRDLLVPGPHDGDDVAVTPSPAGHPGNLPGVSLRVGGEPDGCAAVRLIGDEPLRVAVALIDAMREAEQAPAEPDEHEARELARVLHRTHCIPGGCRNEEPSSGDLDEARAALKWMKDKQRGAGSCD